MHFCAVDTVYEADIFVVIFYVLLCCWLFLQKSLTSSGDVQYNLRMCVAVKRRLQVTLLFSGSSCPLMWAMDGHIMCCSTISLCQSVAITIL